MLRHGQVVKVSVTLDSRPLIVEHSEHNPDALDEWVSRRLLRFEDYWKRTFAPLLKENDS